MTVMKTLFNQVMQEHIDMEGQRDEVFREVLDYHKHTINIFQIGAIETLDNVLFKIGSGWSDITFGKHIKKYGGSLTVCDISLDHLANSKIMSDFIGYDCTLNYGDGLQYIEDRYDIYYLDGSNDPFETEAQFNKVIGFGRKDIHILVDDFIIKGATLDLEKYPFKVYDIEKGLGVLHYG